MDGQLVAASFRKLTQSTTQSATWCTWTHQVTALVKHALPDCCRKHLTAAVVAAPLLQLGAGQRGRHPLNQHCVVAGCDDAGVRSMHSMQLQVGGRGLQAQQRQLARQQAWWPNSLPCPRATKHPQQPSWLPSLKPIGRTPNTPSPSPARASGPAPRPGRPAAQGRSPTAAPPARFPRCGCCRCHPPAQRGPGEGRSSSKARPGLPLPRRRRLSKAGAAGRWRCPWPQPAAWAAAGPRTARPAHRCPGGCRPKRRARGSQRGCCSGCWCSGCQLWSRSPSCWCPNPCYSSAAAPAWEARWRAGSEQHVNVSCTAFRSRHLSAAALPLCDACPGSRWKLEGVLQNQATRRGGTKQRNMDAPHWPPACSSLTMPGCSGCWPAGRCRRCCSSNKWQQWVASTGAGEAHVSHGQGSHGWRQPDKPAAGPAWDAALRQAIITLQRCGGTLT